MKTQLLCILLVLLIGCAPVQDYETHDPAASLPTDGLAAPRPGTSVATLKFLYAFENEPGAFYYPIEGIGGCEFSAEGTLIFTDQKRGKVYGLDGGTRRWYEFDAPFSRPYQPIDVTVDGFKVLVLDLGAGRVTRYDLNGAYLDVLVEIRQVDPVIQTSPSAFAVDRDGRMIIADSAQQQVLMLDTFQNLNMRIGDPGSMPDQFDDPSGLAYLPDGSFMVADRGNRRLARYGRLGFFEGVVDADATGKNPFLAPGGMDADRFGNLFVADPGFGVVHVLGRRLDYEFTFRGEDNSGLSSEGELSAPLDVSVGPDDLLAVTDRDRAAVLVYRIIYE